MDAQTTHTDFAFFTDGFPPRKHDRDLGPESYGPDTPYLFRLGHFGCYSFGKV